MGQSKVFVEITGISSLLMHRYPMVPIEALEKKPAEEQARLALHLDPQGIPYVPGTAFQRALVNAATYSKGKGRATLQKVVAASVMVAPEHATLNGAKWVVDSRPIVMPSTRGRVIRHRPRFDSWVVTFEITWDPDLMTETQLRRIVDDCGSRVGLLDFRPERKGPFGRFMVTKWLVANAQT